MLRSTTFCLIAAVMVLTACDQGPDADTEFTGLAHRYLEALTSRDPVWATQLGDHDHDGVLPDMSLGAHEAWADFNLATRDSLLLIDQSALSPADRIDYSILMEQIDGEIFAVQTLQEHRWNPLHYNPGDAIYSLLARDFAPLPDRLRLVAERLMEIPVLLETARINLDQPPTVFTTTAITQNRGTINLVMDGLAPYLDLAPELRPQLAGPRAEAIAALTVHEKWLEEELLPRSTGDFRLGLDKWRQKLRYSLSSDLTPEEIMTSAEHDLEETTNRLHEVALSLYRTRLGESATDPATLGRREVIAAVLDDLAQDHPTSETIVQQARDGLVDITDFVREQDLVMVPSEPVEIIVMPEHQRGMYIAYCDSPGPLEPELPCFYAIAPTPAHWTQERSDSFYREYNDYMLQNLSIHEAMPGHYLQINHSNRFEGSTPVRAVFSSGTFVEGWATYSEQLMVEAGWGGAELEMQQLKMRLRLIINAIIDQKIHTAGMTEDEALALMMEQGFQEEGEATGKWVRACLTSTQLSTYYVGNMEINGIRRDWQERAGASYDHRTFHDQLLSYGSPAPKHVRTMLELQVD